MKKLKLSIFAFMLLFSGSNIFGQALEKGKVAFNAYYGVNIFTAIFKTAYQNSGGNGSAQTDFKIKGMGPIGLSGEYMVTDKVGLGGDFYYANTSISWNETYSDYYNSTTGNYETRTYNYKVSVPRFAALFRANLHFTEDDNFDSYGIIAAGYKNMSFKFETNDPDYQFAKISSLIPVGLKLGIGFRYFFTDNIGINAEIAAGTPLLCGGLSAKF
jgi:opacity protein-like surface antigen